MRLSLSLLILSVSLLLSCGRKHDDEKKNGNDDSFALSDAKGNKLRPYQLINQTLKSRLMERKSKFDISNYIDSQDPMQIFVTFDASLKKLLGTYNGKGLTTEFIGSEPNAMNMMLWRMVLISFSQDISKLCTDAKPSVLLNFREGFTKNLAAICDSPDLMDSAAFATLWDDLQGHDAPKEVKTLWLAFVAEGFEEKEEIDLIVSEAVLAALYNPYFLIEH